MNCPIDLTLTPLFFTRHPITITIHFSVGTMLQKKCGFLTCFNTQDDTQSVALCVALKQKGLRPFCLNDPPSMAGFQPKRKFDKAICEQCVLPSQRKRTLLFGILDIFSCCA